MRLFHLPVYIIVYILLCLSLTIYSYIFLYDFMLKNGISSKRMSYAGYGINNPRYSNENEEGRMKNRRIEIKLDVNNEL